MTTKEQKKDRRLPDRVIAQEERSKTDEVSLIHSVKNFPDLVNKEHTEIDGKTKETKSVEFMLKEYERLTLLRMDEVKQSEQRVTFFLTIASAVIGIIVVLAQTSSLPLDKILVIARVALIVLLLFGLTIQNRMNARVAQLNTLDKLMAEVRDYFRNSYPEFTKYFDKRDKLFQPPKYRFNITIHILRRLRGTLIDLIVLSNSLICGGIAFIEFYGRGYRGNLIIGLTLAIVTGAAALLYMYYYFFMKRLPPLAG